MKKLPAIPETDRLAEVHPTLFLGIGQTATTVLRQLRRRLRERFGSDDMVPALRILCLDTDCRDLSAATSGQGSDTLTSREVLPVPLRKPEDYRRDATMHLSWLSRRWIYNVPRSLQTEGIRPLGRLAFADHHEKIFDELHRAIEQVTLPEALARTAETVELEPAESPRVYLVASIAGGVGSGMVLDMAYAARSVLLERGLPDDAVIGLLVFSTGRSATERDLTVINAYSCLSELHHFSQTSGFPGDDTCDLPSFPEDDLTFSQTYLVDIGEDLSQDQFEVATSGLAEYLFLNSVTRCASYFDTFREYEELTDKMMLRSLGISQTAAAVGDVATMPASVLAQHLASRWVEPEEQESPAVSVDDQVEKALGQLHLSPRSLMRRLAEATRQKTDQSLEELVSEALSPLRNSAWMMVAEGRAQTLFEQMEATLDVLLGITPPQKKLQMQMEIGVGEALGSVAAEILQDLSAQLSTLVWSNLHRPGHRGSRTHRALTELTTRLHETTQEIGEIHQQTRTHLRQLEESFRDPGDLPKEPQALAQRQSDFASAISRYASLRLQELFAGHTRRLLVRLQTHLADQGTTLHEIQQAFSRMATRFQTCFVDEQRAACYGVSNEQRLVSNLMLKQVMMDLATRRDEVDQVLQRELEVMQTDLKEMFIRDGGHGRTRVEALMLRVARSIVSDQLRRVDLDQLFRAARVADTEVSSWLQRELEAATPRLLPRCGGASRLLLAVPEESSATTIAKCLEEQFNETPSIVRATHGDVVVCYEVEQIPLVTIATTLIQSRPDCADLVAHLHTRNDVDWTPLICPE